MSTLEGCHQIKNVPAPIFNGSKAQHNPVSSPKNVTFPKTVKQIQSISLLDNASNI